LGLKEAPIYTKAPVKTIHCGMRDLVASPEDVPAQVSRRVGRLGGGNFNSCFLRFFDKV
jgi:hypothetical protein